jgi:hypothetical protein
LQILSDTSQPNIALCPIRQLVMGVQNIFCGDSRVADTWVEDLQHIRLCNSIVIYYFTTVVFLLLIPGLFFFGKAIQINLFLDFFMQQGNVSM